MKITISRNGEKLGPYSVEEINARLLAGELKTHDWAWPEGASDWVPLGNIAGIGNHPPATPIAVQPTYPTPDSSSSPMPQSIKEHLHRFVRYLQSPVTWKMMLGSTARPTAKTKKAKAREELFGCLGLIICVLFVVMVFNKCTGKHTESENTAATPKKEDITKQFSAWDGSHRALETRIKKSMNDPDSYKHVETVYWAFDDHLIVKTTYRGKNRFGGVVTEWIKARVGLDGNVQEIVEQGNAIGE